MSEKETFTIYSFFLQGILTKYILSWAFHIPSPPGPVVGWVGYIGWDGHGVGVGWVSWVFGFEVRNV